jgi:hypothetical protein
VAGHGAYALPRFCTRGAGPGFGEFRASGGVVIGPFTDVRALVGRLRSRDSYGAAAATGAVAMRGAGVRPLPDLDALGPQEQPSRADQG